MVTAMHRRKRLATLVMVLMLVAMSLSVIGEAFSHGVAELATASDQTDHFHSHDAHNHESGGGAELSAHHDPGNHTHESVDQLKLPPLPQSIISLQHPDLFAGGLPRSFPYRLDRPPKATLPA